MNKETEQYAIMKNPQQENCCWFLKKDKSSDSWHCECSKINNNLWFKKDQNNISLSPKDLENTDLQLIDK